MSGAAWAAPEAEGGQQARIRPIFEARLRYEHVEQGALDAEAATFRARAGAEAKIGAWSLLAEAEATVAPLDDYNAFPFALPAHDQFRPAFAVVPDPENLELNRLQLRYEAEPGAVTLGRQRINLDDQRWVGSVGWRQNEQTFDAVRGEARFGALAADLTYANSQRTLFGEEAGPRTAYDGDFVFAGLTVSRAAITAKLFAYLLDYDEPFFLANSSQTYGGIVSTALPLGAKTNLSLRASYARQSDHGDNPFEYAADYVALEAGTTLAGFGLTAGWEKLGSDRGRAVQTPMGTLHKFNGWADLFLTTPAAGLEDAYVSVSRKFDGGGSFPASTPA